MSYAPVLRFVALSLFAVGIAAAAPFFLALFYAETEPGSFAAGLFLSGFFGACFYALSESIDRRRSTRSGFRELLLALALFWAAVPFAAALPFMGRDFGLWDAWFEAVSALTTTGGWISEPAARSTISGLVYRASLEWLGGIASLATAAAVFVRPEFVGIAPPVPPFARGRRDSYLRAFSSAVFAFAPVYAGLTAISFGCFFVTGVPVWEAASLALSLIASGGLSTIPGGIAGYGIPTVIVANLTLIVSAINFVVIARLAIKGSGRLKAGPDPETRAFLLLIIPVGLLYWVSLGTFEIGALPVQFANAVSMLSTNGTLIGAAPQLTPLLVTAVIGGAAVSTAGGIKLLRWLITFRKAGQELWQLTNPGAVFGAGSSATFEFGVWIHTIAFTIVLAALVLTVGFFGYDLELAAATAVAVVTNAGPLLGAVQGSTADFIQFTEPLRILLAMGMIAGRLELVLLLLLLDREFWRA